MRPPARARGRSSGPLSSPQVRQLPAGEFDLALSRMRISAIYAASLLSAAPFLLFKEKAAEVEMSSKDKKRLAAYEA